MQSGITINVAGALGRPVASEGLAPISQKIIDYLDGHDWTRDNYIKQLIAEFKLSYTPIREIQACLQFLELEGYLETRNAGRNGLEAKKI